MPRTATILRSAAALGTTGTLLLAASAPALAQAPLLPDVAGATGATALTVTVNLPGGAASRLVLTLDPVTGEASRVQTGTAALARSEVLSGSIGAQSLGTGATTAALPGPLRASNDPAAAFAAGLADSPLAGLVDLRLLPSEAAVTASPSSASQASVAGLGIGLPDAVAGGLAPLLDPLSTGVDQLLATLAEQSQVPVAQLCGGLTEAVTALGAVSDPLGRALAGLPVQVPVDAVLEEAALGAICELPATLAALRTALGSALGSLTGSRGVIGVDGVTAAQSIDTGPDGVAARSTASVAGLTLLGQQALVGAQVLRTSSSAVATGRPGTATATVESTVAEAAAGTVDPFAQVRATLDGIVDSRVGGAQLPAALEQQLAELLGVLDLALAPVGITLVRSDDAPQAQDLAACPTALDGSHSGTFTAPDGSCAAAATRGIGVAVTLPEQLASALTISGPLVEVQLVPSAAAARLQPTQAPAAAPPAPAPMTELPRTGAESSLLVTVGVSLLVGAALLRRWSARSSA
jgi:LPXTG-motif cell wall-anchored protein